MCHLKFKAGNKVLAVHCSLKLISTLVYLLKTCTCSKLKVLLRREKWKTKLFTISKIYGRWYHVYTKDDKEPVIFVCNTDFTRGYSGFTADEKERWCVSLEENLKPVRFAFNSKKKKKKTLPSVVTWLKYRLEICAQILLVCGKFTTESFHRPYCWSELWSR